MVWVLIAGDALAAAAYGATAAVLFVSRPRRGVALPLIGAITASAVWAGANVWLAAVDSLSFTGGAALDALHLLAWTLCIRSILVPQRATRELVLASSAAAAWALVGLVAGSFFASTVHLALIASSLIGLVAVEQLFRNANAEQRQALRLLCFAAGGLFVVDLFVYSQAGLLDAALPWFWYGRGFAHLAFLPLIILAVKRLSVWERELSVSRQVVFHMASVLGVGFYLMLLGLAAYVVRAVGREWTFVIELQFLLVAFGVLVFILYSEGMRRRLQTFLIKHFYRNKYDYRREWLRLTDSLSRSGELGPLASSGLEALAQIVGTRSGDLWLERDDGHYEWMASIGRNVAPQRSFRADHLMVRFMAARSWVIDSDEYSSAPDRYEMAFGDPAAAILPPKVIVVPLDCHGHLQGFVMLDKRDQETALNFEDHDILKTAGKQVAIALAQAHARERLAETHQFEAMNKMSAFLMHDLKNILAQQLLLVSNAARFRHRPEFFDDAIATVRAGVERMRRVVEQIQTKSADVGANRADLVRVLKEIGTHFADRLPRVDVDCPYPSVWVRMSREKLGGVLTHLVRNAQDATADDGRVRLGVTRSGDSVLCVLEDNGCGMDDAFIRDRLFRPFDSTKADRGMGIGAYQARELVRAAGGEIEVESAPGVGTTFRVHLRAADSGYAKDHAGAA